MNPTTSFSWSPKPPENKIEYRILREKKTICFGDPGYITEWQVYEKFDSGPERDARFYELQTEHPMWHLQTSEANPYFEQLLHRAVW